MERVLVDMSRYHNTLGLKHKLSRMLWVVTWTLLARPFPRSLASGWKRILLRLFGAKVEKTAVVYSSATIYNPRNLWMGEYSCLASHVDCYNVAPVYIGNHSTVSQGAFLCTASHDITNVDHKLITAPIHIQDQAWVAADAYVGMGITVGEGAVVGARAVVVKDVEPWTVVGGNPARVINKRCIASDRTSNNCLSKG